MHKSIEFTCGLAVFLAFLFSWLWTLTFVNRINLYLHRDAYRPETFLVTGAGYYRGYGWLNGMVAGHEERLTPMLRGTPSARGSVDLLALYPKGTKLEVLYRPEATRAVVQHETLRVLPAGPEFWENEARLRHRLGWFVLAPVPLTLGIYLLVRRANRRHARRRKSLAAAGWAGAENSEVVAEDGVRQAAAAMSSGTSLDEPVVTSCSFSANLHRLVRPSPAVLVLKPGCALWFAMLYFLALSLGVLAFCLGSPPKGVPVYFPALFFLFGAVVVAVGAICFGRFGTRVRMDRERQQVKVTGVRHGVGGQYRFSDIAAVQFCDGGIKKGKGDAAWRSYQVNLVLNAATPHRINLLDSGAKPKLQIIAQNMADFLQVPLLYVGSPSA